MTRSANEVSGLATKAARGAGAPPAQAAQFGAVAAVHLGAGRDLKLLNLALDTLPLGPILTLPLDIARLAEQSVEGHAQGRIDNSPAALVHSYLESLSYVAQVDEDGVVYLNLNEPAARLPPVRVDLDEAVYEAWSALAANLLVPESDVSRLSGAGAGLSDND